VPTSLLASTIKAATLLAMGKAAASALISVQVTALMEGVMKTMFLTKIKSTAVVVLAMALSGVGVATLAVGGARQRETASAAKTQDEKPVANAPKNNPAKEDEEKLQGVWDVVSVVHDGKPVEKKFFDGQVWVFEGDTLRGVSRATYKLDPSQMPKAIDLIRKSPRSNEAEKVVTLHGIYELKGDDLKIALPPDGGERPKNFDSTAENHTAVNVLKRAHGAKKQAPKDEDSGI